MMGRLLKKPSKNRGSVSLKKMKPTVSGDRGKASTALAGILVFLLGIGLTLFVVVNPMKVGLLEKVKQTVAPQAGMGPASGEIGKRKIKYWRAPMDATYISDKPGKSPMGMDLIPVYEDEAQAAPDTAITIEPATVQNIGVITEVVERGELKVDIRTVGTLDYNDNKVFWINTKYDGWIEKVYVNYVGEEIRKGEALFEIYSPDLVTTQEEYLSALKYRDRIAESGFPDASSRAKGLLEATRSRMLNWDITDEQIKRLEEKGQITRTLTVVSPVTGMVVEKMDQALEGMYAKAGMNLYKVADLSSLWVHVDIYEYQLPWITIGQRARIEISYYPGEVFEGKVLFFFPYLDKKTRTTRVCLEIPNSDRKLRPDMFATVTFSPVAAEDAVLVPEMAVLHSGERDVVVLDLGGGRFEPREVKLGLQGGGMYQVLEGLEGGEKIVTSSQFLIDSESNLREAINKMLMAKEDISRPVEDGSETKGMEHGSGTKSSEHGSDTKGAKRGTKMKGVEQSGHQVKPLVEDSETIEMLGEILGAYLPIWKSLAGDSKAGIEENAKKLASVAGDAARRTDMATLKARLETLQDKASAMRTGNLVEARESMKHLSRALVVIFESHDVKMPSRFSIIECPMIKEKWIQDTEQVSNPFFGSSMPRCGIKVGEFG